MLVIKKKFNLQSRFLIEILSKSYVSSLRCLQENEDGILNKEQFKLDNCRKIVRHIEAVADTLSPKERFIIIKEVIEGQTGKLYLGYFSPPSYYRIRAKAYKNFLHCLEE